MASVPDASAEKFESPSDIASDELRKRVEADTDLDKEIQAAFLSDLSSEAPHELSTLKGVLGTKADKQ